MARGDEFRKAYGGLLEARSLQDYREGITETSKAKRILDQYQSKVNMMSKYTDYIAKYPKHIIRQDGDIYYIDNADGKGEQKISKTAFDQLAEENKQREEGANRYALGIGGYDNLFTNTSSYKKKDTGKQDIIIKQNNDGDLTVDGKTADDLTTEADDAITKETIQEEKKLQVSPAMTPNVRTAGMTLDKNDMIGTNYAKIKGTDQYYDLRTGNRVSEGVALRDTPEGRRVMDQFDAMSSLPETPTLAGLPRQVGMQLNGTTTDAIEDIPGFSEMSKEQQDNLKRLRDEGINEFSSIDDKLNYQKYDLGRFQQSTNFDSTLRGADEVSPFGFAKRLEMSRRAGQFKKSFNPNTGEFTTFEPNMGVSITPNTSGGITVGSMTNMPTGLQEISDGALTANFKSGTPTLENEESVQRLIEHRKKYGDPNLGTGYYAGGVNDATGSTPQDRIVQRQFLDTKKRALQGYLGDLAKNARFLHRYAKEKLPKIPDDGYANPYFPK